MLETSRLATTIETWWPHVLNYLLLGVTNARTEGYNRIIKQVKRAGCSYRNMTNYERRILTHINHLALLCWPHHRQVDEGRWILKRNPDRHGDHWLTQPQPRHRWRR